MASSIPMNQPEEARVLCWGWWPAAMFRYVFTLCNIKGFDNEEEEMVRFVHLDSAWSLILSVHSDHSEGIHLGWQQSFRLPCHTIYMFS